MVLGFCISNSILIAVFPLMFPNEGSWKKKPRYVFENVLASFIQIAFDIV